MTIFTPSRWARSLGSALTGIAALAAFGTFTAPASAKIGSCDGPITFGTTVSQSGRYSTLAARWAPMTEAFAEELNKDGGIMVKSCGKKLPLKMVIYDDQSVPSNAVALFEKLATVDKVDFFVGPDWSAFGGPVPPIAEKHGIPIVMANVAAPPVYRRGLKWVFGTPMPTVPLWSQRYFEMLKTLPNPPKTIFFVTQDNPITKALTGFWSKKTTAMGFKTVGTGTFSTELKDFTALVLKMKAAKADIIYISSFDIPSVPLIKQMKRLRVKAKDVHHTILSGALAKQLGKDMHGISGELAWYQGMKGDYSEFAERVLARAKIDMFEFPYSMSRLTAYLVLVQAIEKAGVVDREAVRAALVGGGFKSPIGAINFDKGGYPTSNGAFTLQFQNGKVVMVWPKERATGKFLYPSPNWQ